MDDIFLWLQLYGILQIVLIPGILLLRGMGEKQVMIRRQWFYFKIILLFSIILPFAIFIPLPEMEFELPAVMTRENYSHTPVENTAMPAAEDAQTAPTGKDIPLSGISAQAVVNIPLGGIMDGIMRIIMPLVAALSLAGSIWALIQLTRQKYFEDNLEKNAFRVRRIGRVTVIFSSIITVPFSSGVVNRKVFIPRITASDPEELRAVLSHEFTHIREGHLFWSLLDYLHRSVFWFNPAARMVSAIGTAVREHICDQETIKKVPLIQYVKLLVRTAEDYLENQKNLVAAPGLHIPNLLLRRINFMKNKNKPNTKFFTNMFLAVLILAIAAFGISLSCVSTGNRPDESGVTANGYDPLRMPPNFYDDPELSRQYNEMSQKVDAALEKTFAEGRLYVGAKGPMPNVIPPGRRDIALLVKDPQGDEEQLISYNQFISYMCRKDEFTWPVVMKNVNIASDEGKAVFYVDKTASKVSAVANGVITERRADGVTLEVTKNLVVTYKDIDTSGFVIYEGMILEKGNVLGSTDNYVTVEMTFRGIGFNPMDLLSMLEE